MKILFLDTETTGLPSRYAPPEDQGQPWCVQVAWLMQDTRRPELDGRHFGSLIIQPPGKVRVSPQAADVHRLTDDVIADLGIPAANAFRMLGPLVESADLLVAHNEEFDRARLIGDFVRLGSTVYGSKCDEVERWFCTMRAATPIVNLPPTDRMRAAGFDKPKPPKLEEAIAHFWPGETIAGAHDAMVDLRACQRLFWRLVALGHGPSGVEPMQEV